MSYSKNKEKMKEEMIRINHAGEFAAKRIYEGQLKFIRDDKSKKLIQEMAKGEEKHLEYFEQQIKENNYRPTALHPLVGKIAYTAGALSAICGKNTAMLMTHAVEDVIAEHYKEQEELLKNDDKKLHKTIEEFRKEEEQHHDIAEEYDLTKVPGHKLLNKMIKAGCHIGIKLTKKI